MEKQRKDEQEREILLKAAKVADTCAPALPRLQTACRSCKHNLTFVFQSRARQEDPEQIRLKQKAKEVRLRFMLLF